MPDCSAHAQPRFQVWAPGLFDFKGGIQVYSQFLLDGLQTLYPDAPCDIFLMHDRKPNGLVNNQSFSYQTKGGNDSAKNYPSAKNHTVHYSGQIPSRVRSLAFGARLLAAGLWQPPDLIITTHLNFTVVAEQIKRLTGVPYWAIAHGFEAWDIQRPALRRALSNADRILAVSHYTRDRLLQDPGLDPNRVQLLPNTFDANRFQVAPKPQHLLQQYGLRPEQPIILTVNRLAAAESFHSYDQILAALPTIRAQIPDVHYVIVGKGDDRPRLEQLMAAQHLQDCVTLAGFIPDAELPDYYNLCDVFAMPSKLEGFGIVYLEALASGKPVLAGTDGGVDAVQKGQLGALVDPDHIEAIAHSLIQIFQKSYPNPLIYQPDALRQAVIKRFGFDAFCQTLSALFATAPLDSARFPSIAPL